MLAVCVWRLKSWNRQTPGHDTSTSFQNPPKSSFQNLSFGFGNIFFEQCTNHTRGTEENCRSDYFLACFMTIEPNSDGNACGNDSRHTKRKLGSVARQEMLWLETLLQPISAWLQQSCGKDQQHKIKGANMQGWPISFCFWHKKGAGESRCKNRSTCSKVVQARAAC